MIDYVTVGALAALPRVFGWHKGLSTFLMGRQAGKGAWAIGKRTEPSTWARAAKWLGRFGRKAA